MHELSQTRPSLLGGVQISDTYNYYTVIAYIVCFQKWKKMMDLFSSTFGRFLRLYNCIPKMDGYMTHFSYIVRKLNNNHPNLDCSSQPLLDEKFTIK